MNNFSKRKITEADRTFSKEIAVDENKFVYTDCLSEPIKIYGTYVKGGSYSKDFVRLPRELDVDGGVNELKYNTAGVRLRFITDSPQISLRIDTPFTPPTTIRGISVVCGFDLHISTDDAPQRAVKQFAREAFSCTLPQDKSEDENSYYRIFNQKKIYGGACAIGEGSKTVEIYFPNYNNVNSVQIGLCEGSSLSEPKPYKITAPVVFAGSSITQGANSTRQGNAYQGFLERRFGFDFINLGFSGSFRAQKPLLDYILSLSMPMSAFVYDYDHNAPTPEFLKETHEPFFLELRKKYPDLPVVMISRPDYHEFTGDATRRSIIYTTYSNALAKGDRNVYFIDGESFFKLAEPSACTADECHPNDLGFWCMAQVIAPVLKEIFEKRKLI